MPKHLRGVGPLAAVVVAAACSSGAGRANPSTTTTTVASASATSSPVTTGLPTTATTATTVARPVTCAAGTGSSGPGGGADPSAPGDIPDTQAFVSFTPTDHHYRLDIPEGWARTETASDAQFVDKLIRVDIRVVSRATAPTAATTRATELSALTGAIRCFALVSIDDVQRRSGAVVRVVYHADSEPDSVTGKVVRDDVERYEFWRAGTEAIVTLSAPAGSDNVDVWRRTTDSFAWR